MIAFTPKTITPTFSNIPLENISNFDKNSGYISGSIRKYQNYKYIALDDIAPTVNHVWYDLEPLNIYGYDLYTDSIIPDATSVSVTNNVTIVFVQSLKKYFRANTTGTVNYTTENWSSPTNFTDLGINPTPLYRTKLDYPNGKKDTLLWGYEGVLNRFIMFDGVLNAQTINDRSFNTNNQVTFSTNVCLLTEALSSNIYVNDTIKIVGTDLNDGYYKIVSIAENRLSFTVEESFTSEIITGNITFYTQTYIKFNETGTNRIAFFNMYCESIEIKVTVDGNTTAYNIPMTDSSWINSFELFVFNTPDVLTNSIVEIYPNYGQEFEITFFGNTQKIGEVIQGVAVNLGLVEDSSTINTKVYAEIEEASNGDIYVEEEITQFDVLDRKSFTMVIDSNKIEAHRNYINGFLGKRVVIAGSDSDKDNYRFLLTYGLIKDDTFNPRVRQELCTYNFEIREFKEWQS